MAIHDGDPRKVAPVLFRRLTRLERKQVLAAYAREFGPTLRGPGQRGDGTPPEVIARRSIVGGLGTSLVAITLLPLALFVVCLTIALGGSSGSWTVAAWLLGAYLVTATVIVILRTHFLLRRLAYESPEARYEN